MWLKLDLEGMIFKLKIEKYDSKKLDDDDWAKVSFSFKFGNIINYSESNAELMQNQEINILESYLKRLLEDKIKEKKTYNFIEPDFEMDFYPKMYSTDPNLIYIKPGTEVADISMDLRVNLWSDGLTGNYFSMSFDREDIEKFYTYLLLVTNKIDKNDEKVQKLIEAGTLYGEEL